VICVLVIAGEVLGAMAYAGVSLWITIPLGFALGVLAARLERK
jgi:hypothetical protein